MNIQGLLANCCFASFFIGVSAPLFAANIEIDTGDRRQVMDGFGAASCFFEERLARMNPAKRDEVYDLIFKDLGATLLRIRVYADLNRKRDLEYNWRCMETQREIVQAALKRGVIDTVWAAVWSPPEWMKSTGRATQGGRLLKEHYGDYANYLAAYVSGMKKQYGIEIKGLSIFNEPGFVQSWETTEVTGEEYRDILKVAAKRFRKKGLDTRFFGPDTSNIGHPECGVLGGGFAKALLEDPESRKALDTIITHQYGEKGDSPTWAALADFVQPYGKHIWQSEMAKLNKATDELATALEVASWIQGAIVNGRASAWHHWQYYWPKEKDGAQGLVTIDSPDSFTVNKRYYAFKQWSKNVRPGAICVGATCDDSRLRVAAFEDKGQAILVALNRSNEPARLEVSCPKAYGAAQQIRTSGQEDYKTLPSLTISGGHFTADLPARSIATFIMPVGVSGKHR